MKGIGRGLALLALIGLAGSLLIAPRRAEPARQAPKEGGVVAHKDVEYGVEDGESLKLDLFLPAGEAQGRTRPGLIFIHGGGWSGGDKSEFDGKAEEMARRGYVAITVNYRLAPKHRFPAALKDVQLAVRWLRGRADDYHLNPDRIGSMGASAGGHLAAFIGVHGAWDPGAMAGAPSSSVNCVVDYFGRMDLTLKQGGHDYRPDFIGKSGPEALDAYREASPITYVDANSCPFLIVQGARDPQVAQEQSQRMLEALDKANVEASLLLLGGQGHGFQGAGARQAWDAAKNFLDAHLMPARH